MGKDKRNSHNLPWQDHHQLCGLVLPCRALSSLWLKVRW